MKTILRISNLFPQFGRGCLSGMTLPSSTNSRHLLIQNVYSMHINILTIQLLATNLSNKGIYLIMSLTNDTILLWTLYDDAYNNATHIDFYITMAATSVFLLIFARLVWNDRNSHAQKSVFTSFNVLLFSMIMSNALALIFQFIYDESTVPLFVNIYISISYFFIC
ncbi:hypothetical protein BCR33DRAFT_846768, partial [Rhizoclosmatium globosum]